MSFPFPPPQGYPGGGSQPVKVATGSATSAASSSTFYDAQGIAISLVPLAVTPPVGASSIIAVHYRSGVASPLGYVDGLTQGTLQDAPGYFALGSGGALSLTAENITIAVHDTSTLYNYSVFYQ